jgi:hypothetical protein
MSNKTSYTAAQPLTSHSARIVRGGAGARHVDMPPCVHTSPSHGSPTEAVV